MAGYISDDSRKVTTHRLVEMKQRGEKISMLTAYDYTMAQIVDGAGMDVILVGDSASNVMAGNVTTLPITLDQMIYHAKSVVRGVKRAMVVVDMPFGSYQGNEMEGLASAIRIMKETAADAIKLEGGEEILESIQRILSAGIPAGRVLFHALAELYFRQGQTYIRTELLHYAENRCHRRRHHGAGHRPGLCQEEL